MENVLQRERTSGQISDLFVVITAGIGLLLSTLDTGIINVAMPTFLTVFHSTVTGIAWTVTLYTQALTGTIVLFGRISDRVGHLKVYGLGLVVFAASSILCGLSQSVAELITFRTVQGIGAAMLQATSAAIITTIIPHDRRGSALGTLGILMGLGPVLGPSIGGVIISFVSWRWIFWINIPITLIALVGCRRLNRLVSEPRGSVRLNILGNLLLSLSVLALLESVSLYAEPHTPTLMVFSCSGLFVALLAVFIIREIRIENPIIDLRLFGKGNFTGPMLAVFFFGGATSLGFIVPPYFLEGVHYLAPWKTGLVNLSAPLGLVLLSKVSGKLMEKVSAKSLMVTGLIIMVVSYGVLSLMRADWSPIVLGALLLIYGVGSGIFVPANLGLIMAAVGNESQGTIGAVQRMVQNLGIAVGTAVAAALIRLHSGAGPAGLMVGFRGAWGYAAATLAVSLVLLVLFDMRKRMV